MSAAVLKAEIDDARRVSNRKKTRSNFGIATSVRDSADTQHRGRITKQGPGVVRKVLVQGALHFAKHNQDTARKYDRLSRQKGKGIARVAAGGDLLDTVYPVLKTRTAYRHAASRRVTRKTTEPHRRAAQAKRRSVP